MNPTDRGERLESWKEIAGYLGRGITTVQRWELLEGLPVHRLAHAKKGSVFAIKSELDAWQTARAQFAPSKAIEPAQQLRWARVSHSVRGLPLVAVMIIGAAAAAIPIARAVRGASASAFESTTLGNPQPLATEPGDEMCPSLSPDGKWVVFHWDRPGDPGLYIKPVAGGEPKHLRTEDAGELFACGFPKWSPAGDLIAFLTTGDAVMKNLWVIAPAGAAARRLTSVSGIGLCWAPDGRTLGFVDRNSPGEPFSIFSVTLDGTQRERLTSPPAGAFGDAHCAFSPDGRTLALSRFPNISQSDLFLVPIDTPGKAPLRLTTGFVGMSGIAWSPNGQELVLGSHVGLWRIPASGAQPPTRVAAFEGGGRFPTFARSAHGVQLAYGAELRDVNNWRWDISRARANKLASSTWWEDYPAVSPSAKLVAFTSNRTGAAEIWTSQADGSAPRQVTFHGGPVVTAPSWSPDGKWLAFSSEVGGNRDIYIIRPDGSQSNRLTTAPSEERNPSWSRDGQWIYFRSDQAGVGHVWKVRVSGGLPVRVTTGEASEAFESPDGKTLYFVRNTHLPGLWSVPVDGGTENLVLPDVREDWWGVSERGIFYLVAVASGLTGAAGLKFFDFASRKVSDVPAPPTLSRAVQPGFSVSRDGRFVFWTQVDNVLRDLMLVDPWSQ